MKTFLAQFIVPCVLLSFCSTLSAADLGETAAPLDIAQWVKGDAVDLAAVKGKKVVVVEFWATWCGPCLASIPHLTELQKKFEKRGVVFVGVTDEDSSKVKPFVDKMGEKMDYTVAIDRNNATSDGYMKRYAQNGIPHAFVVDKEGRIAWHGHPMAGLDRVLDQIAANTFDMAAEKKREGAQQKLEEYFELALKGGTDDSLEPLGLQITALDKQLGGINPGEKLDLAGLRKTARFQGVMRDYQRALVSGRSETELESLEQKARPLAPPDFRFAEFKAQFQLQRTFQEYYRAVTGKSDASTSEALAKKLEALSSDDAEALNQIAWTLLTDENIKHRNLKLAMKMARAAVDASAGKDASVLDTYARALFDTGEVAEAVNQQQRAVNLCDDANKKSELEATLQSYQKTGGPK